MISNILIYTGSIIITIWGIAHIIPTKSIINGFGEISIENKRIITMEWIAEGLTLCFIGVLVLLITLLVGCKNPASIIVYRASAIMLIVMAVIMLFTSARTKPIPMKICPIIKTVTAILFLIASIY